MTTERRCNCYPYGTSPGGYEGPQEHCPIHGRPADEVLQRVPSAMTTETLFEGFDPPPKAEEYLSAGRRKTVNQRRNVEMGRHPLMGSKTHPELGTCGDCRFRRLLEWHDRSYPKCKSEHAPSPTHGAGTDVRAWWPACQFHELGAPKVSPDAARWKP